MCQNSEDFCPPERKICRRGKVGKEIIWPISSLLPPFYIARVREEIMQEHLSSKYGIESVNEKMSEWT